MAYPKFNYNPGSGAVDLLFTYPPVEKPSYDDGSNNELEVQRVDSITLSGKKQVFYVRTDVFRNLTLKYVPFTDMAAWQSFMQWALSGGVFTYYPDSSVLGTHTDYTLEDTTFDPKFVCIGVSSFSMKMRQVV